MSDDENAGRTVRGKVKWFDPVKGYGFIVSEEGGPDILLHCNVLRNFGQGSIADGAHIQVSVQETARGVQATVVHEIDPPDDAEGALSDFGDSAAAEVGGELEPARVKWFDKGKGFGFANVFGRPEDVFIHMEVLRRSGFADLQPGEAVGVKVIEGKRGRMVTQVTPWEHGTHRDEPDM